jgi:hypothetical protein
VEATDARMSEDYVAIRMSTDEKSVMVVVIVIIVVVVVVEDDEDVLED